MKRIDAGRIRVVSIKYWTLFRFCIALHLTSVKFGRRLRFSIPAATHIMFAAIYRKVVKWKTGFWGEKTSGWHYDLLFVVMNLTIHSTGGSRIALLQLPPN